MMQLKHVGYIRHSAHVGACLRVVRQGQGCQSGRPVGSQAQGLLKGSYSLVPALLPPIDVAQV